MITPPNMDLEKIREAVYEFRREGMNVPARVYAVDSLLSKIEEGVYRQISNVARLPGVLSHVCVMPDGHFGYGFPIGGVAAFSRDEGVVSPGGVGYDINCGVRLLASNLEEKDVSPKLNPLIDDLFENIPSGVGSKSRLRASEEDLRRVCEEGARWAVDNGMGLEEDLNHTEEDGCIGGADYSKLGKRARKRGKPQLGTLGSGNHFLELQVVDEIYDSKTAKTYGLTHEGQVTVMIHCGSRGFGYQVADDYIKVMLEASRRQGINLPDKQLACAYINSPEAQDYMKAMNCAVNYAFTNRQCITSWVRDTFKKHLPDATLSQVYDVCHNIAKFEEHGGYGEVCVHRKGATRAFPAGHPGIPSDYRKAGQPVLIPGDMGSESYLLAGLQGAMQESFGSVCHGAGRVMSRKAAKEKIRGEEVSRRLRESGRYVKAQSMAVLAEEHSQAYKDVSQVVKSVEVAGLAGMVAKLKPLGTIKG